MSAPKENTNALGNSGGKTLNDRKLASEVRTLSLQKIKALLEMPEVKMKTDDYELYKAVLIKLAGTVLPRLNEHSGPDGEPLPLLGGLSNGSSNNSNTKASETNKEDTGN